MSKEALKLKTQRLLRKLKKYNLNATSFKIEVFDINDDSFPHIPKDKREPNPYWQSKDTLLVFGDASGPDDLRFLRQELQKSLFFIGREYEGFVRRINYTGCRFLDLSDKTPILKEIFAPLSIIDTLENEITTEMALIDEGVEVARDYFNLNE